MPAVSWPGNAGRNGKPVDLGELLNDQGNVSRLVALATVGRGGKIGRIGFYHQTVEGHFGTQDFRKGGFLEGEHAAYAQHEAGEERQQFGGLGGGAAKTVEHARKRGGQRPERFDHFAVGGTGVDHQRQALLDRPLRLTSEHLQLVFTA